MYGFFGPGLFTFTLFIGVSLLAFTILMLFVRVLLFSRNPVLVLRQFEVTNDPKSENLVRIVGRPEGLIAWLLAIVGLDDETSIQVSRSKIEFQIASLFGQTTRFVPLTSVASTSCGYWKPFHLIFVALLFFLVGVISIAFEEGFVILSICILISAFCLFLYSITKQMMISIETNGSTVMGFKFKRSLIENVAVDISKVTSAINAINQAVVESQSRIPQNR